MPFSSSLDAALDLEILVTERYTGSYFLEEIKGIADATGIDYKVKAGTHYLAHDIPQYS